MTDIATKDHAAFERNCSNAENVIDSKSLERVSSERPDSAFSQRAPETGQGEGRKDTSAAGPKRMDLVAALAQVIRRAAGIFEPLRILVVNTMVIFAVFVGGFTIYKLAAKTSFVVKDISVPASLQEQGITGNVIAQQILDQISEIDAAAGSRKQKAAISGLDFQSTMPTINLPVGGFNMGTIVSEVRRLLGYTETVITGEVFVEEPKDKEQPAKYGLRLRIAGEGPIYKSDAPEPDVQRLITAAAERVMHKFDPINLGYFYYREKDYDKAEETADFALASSTADNYPWAYTMRGLIARDRGKLGEAARNFRQVVTLDPNFGMGHVSLSGILRLDGQLDAAENAARKAIELMPKQHEGYAALALVLLDRGERDQALAEMDKGVAADPKDARSHMAQGALRQRLQRYEEAIESYQTSAKLQPSAASLIGAADASTQLNRRDEALTFLQRATQAEPKSVDAWLALGAATRQLHDWKNAEKAFEKALALAPSSPTPVVELANLYVAQKHYAAAEALYAKRERLFRHNAQFLMGWSRLYLEEGKKDDAKDKLLEAQVEAMFDTRALESVARELEARGDIPEAIAAYQKIVAVDPKMAEILTPQIDKLSARLEPKTPVAQPRVMAPATSAKAAEPSAKVSAPSAKAAEPATASASSPKMR
ncbi:MAG TPA: tetratricopeptide repeat protein [Methylocystis sp.]|nr:tetratricopeptide repeat protein [Methylocystis sp.]